MARQQDGTKGVRKRGPGTLIFTLTVPARLSIGDANNDPEDSECDSLKGLRGKDPEGTLLTVEIG